MCENYMCSRWPMSATEVILSLECSLLVLFILLMIGALILYKWRDGSSRNTTKPNNSKKRSYIVLPHSNAESVQLERNIKQVQILKCFRYKYLKR